MPAVPKWLQYAQEALDEIEYVSGPADSEWGKRRAADGFPQPFPLHFVEIGNEDWFDKSGSYDGRFTADGQGHSSAISAIENHCDGACKKRQARPL